MMLAHFAKHPLEIISAKTLSVSLHLPYPIVSKLLKILSKAKFLESVQGAQGGYRLVRSAEEISVGAIVEAIEGPIAITECSSGIDGQCRSEDWCSLKPHWVMINLVIKKALAKLPLSDLVQPAPAKMPEHQLEKVWENIFHIKAN